MTFRYIGSKARLVTTLRETIGSHSVGSGRLVDAFCGTGAVAEMAAAEGWPIWINDSLVSAGVMSAARLTSSSEASFLALGGYKSAVQALNEAEPTRGYIWRTYSPASAAFDEDGIERRYFTEFNAGRLDAMRGRIAEWIGAGIINAVEERLLLADMLSAANRCANIAGTYGCFLSTWQSSAMRSVSLEPRELKPEPTQVEVTAMDVASLVVRPDDLVYLDPPYTKRQYASYYHILETIVLGDEPAVVGVSGLRPWKEKASAFCYKRRAMDALVSLISGLASHRVILSYSAEGHVDLELLTERLSIDGKVDCRPVSDIGRYRPNRSASSNGDSVTEYILTYERMPSRSPCEKGLARRAPLFPEVLPA